MGSAGPRQLTGALGCTRALVLQWHMGEHLLGKGAWYAHIRQKGQVLLVRQEKGLYNGCVLRQGISNSG